MTININKLLETFITKNNKNIMKKLKQIIPIEFVLVIIVILLMILFNGSKTKLILEANADELTFNLEVPDTNWTIIDYNRLAKAVARHETADCTKGYGLSHNNCHGIMTWQNGYRQPKYYGSPSESYGDFVRIWKTYYKRLPDYQLAKKYSGNDRANHWLKNVTYFYNE